MLELEGGTVRYGDTVALNDASLLLEEGGFAAVTGPSGCGKTTLLHVLAGLLEPADGRCLVRGTDLYGLKDRQRTVFRRNTIGLVFQSFNLISYLTAQENVELPLHLQGLPHAEQVRRAAALLERLGLNDRASHRPAALSVGEQQRVAVARAIAAGAPILLADEPTGNLDPDATGAVLDLVADEREERGLTVLLVTHNPEVAERADSLVRLVAGRIQEPNTSLFAGQTSNLQAGRYGI
jgi:putative ABC transport system ATP-binding protein